MMESLVSVIVPIYNREKYLSRCIDSISNQTYKNIEIILINDGSTDRTKEICDEYKSKDSRIRVYHIENHGVSYARNLGIKKSSGKYIQFVDSDDYIDEQMIEILVNNIKEYDMVICGFNLHGSYTSRKQTKPQELHNKKEILSNFSELLKLGLFSSVWNKLFCKAKINNLFEEDMKYAEDLMFCLKNIKYVEKIKIIDDCLYNCYLDTPQSLNKSYKKNLFETQTKIYKEIMDLYNIHKEPINTKIYEYYIHTILYYCCIQVVTDKTLKKSVKLNEINRYISSEDVINAAKHIKKQDYIKNYLNRAIIKNKVYNIYLFFYLRQKISKIFKIILNLRKIFKN